jgi:uncharacterized circularly permuted ATP-grasp superfamily protein/uncharacterized alpha-E superfamily protein
MSLSLRPPWPDDSALDEALSGALAGARPATEGHHDELRGALAAADAVPSGVAPLWRRFLRAQGPQGWQELGATLARIRHRVQDDGATYNVYADGAQATRAWPLEALPLLLGPEDWAGIEQGVRQRARLLNQVLADCYGERRLLSQGLLPAPLVLAHPQYLRPMHGCRPAGGVHLHIAAFDLVRGPEGRWWVVAQRTQAPSGLGYLLENRLIVAQQFPQAFRELQVQRLASTFQTLVQGLQRLSPAGERARVALLTPGPASETYFEHVFLARYLGVALVEGADLTVRANKVWLKTLHGLERVDVLLRRVDDDFLDPLELRADSALGVPGLLQALRAGEVVVANAPGAGWLESPGLSAFWPGVARELLGEDLQLPGVTTWWCGEEAAWRSHQTRLDDYVLTPTFPGGERPVALAALTPAERAAVLARVEADPAAYTLQARVRPSETPVWTDGVLQPRAAVLRVFALADGEGGWRVLPGGMTRVAAAGEGGANPWLSMQQGSSSADTWVQTGDAVDPTSLLPRPLTPADLASVHRTVTSRSAENLFWLGRYTERAENSVRLARLTLEALGGAGSPRVLGVLDTLARWHGLVPPELPAAEASARVFERALVQGLGDVQGGVTSVAWNLCALQRCAQALRERLSPEHWRLIRELGEHFSQHLGAVLAAGAAEPLPDVLGVLSRAATHLAALTGAQTDRMTRDDGWRLLSVGRQIERLDFLAHALALGFERGLPAHEDGFALLLGLFDSTITYRAQFQARREVPPLLHLLVHDTDNPRALAWVARTLRDRFLKLSRHDPAWAVGQAAALPVPQDWPLEALCRTDAEGRHRLLEQRLAQACDEVRALSGALGQRLFSHAGAAEQSVWR